MFLHTSSCVELYLWHLYRLTKCHSYVCYYLLPCSDNFKESLAESSKLFQIFPAFGSFVLELSPLKHWNALDIAVHLPADQCLMALSSAKVKDVKDADQVGDA